MRFVLFVEGATEGLPDFLKRWLDVRLPRPVRITPVQFKGWSHYLSEIKSRASLHLAGADVIAGIGLLDLVGPTFYPKEARTVLERVQWGKKHVQQMVGHPRFRQHFAVHETEALLFADPTIHPPEVRKSLSRRPPEEINFDEPPSRLLTKLYQEKAGRNYKKTIDGTRLFSRLDPDRAHAACPHLAAMLDEMLNLASSSK